MGYRDDREAMRQKVGMLEGDLERTRAELDRLQAELARHESKDVADESEKERLEREVATLRRRLGEPAASSDLARQHRWTSIGVACAVLFVGGVVYAVNTSNVDDATKPPAAALADEPVPPKPEASPVPEAPVPEEPVSETLPLMPRPVGPPETILFGAVLQESEGLGLPPGTGCILHLQVLPGPAILHLRVLCDGQTLYDSTRPLGSGMQMSSRNLVELATGDEGERVYVLQYQDEGVRSGPRAELMADSIARSARVRGSSPTPFSAVLGLAHLSAPRRGRSLADGEVPTAGDGRRSILARAVLASSEGPAPRVPSRACELEVHPSYEGGRQDCRVRLRCGTSVLYGAGTTGFNDCTFEDGWPATVDDSGGTEENGDPRMLFDWSARRVVVGDDRGAERWSLTFRLEPMPSDTLAGVWDGPLEGGPVSDVRHIALRVPRRGASILELHGPSIVRDEVEVNLARESPEVTAGPLRLEVGPGGATLLGHFTPDDGVPRPIALVRRLDE